VNGARSESFNRLLHGNSEEAKLRP
jgi:hypothetical protein